MAERMRRWISVDARLMTRRTPRDFSVAVVRALDSKSGGGVQVAGPLGLQGLGVGRVEADRQGDLVADVLDEFLAFVDGNDLVPGLRKRLCQAPAEPAKPDDHEAFHRCLLCASRAAAKSKTRRGEVAG
jgi:hypothetical protein